MARIVRQLSHEARNVLQRSQGALERLRWRLAGHDESLALLSHAEAAQLEMVRLCEAALDFVTPLKIQRAPHNLADVWRESVAGMPGHVAVTTNFGSVSLNCALDRGRLVQAFRHLLGFLTATAQDTAGLTMTATETLLAGRPSVQLTFQQSGPSLTAEEARQLFDPFATDRPRKHQLGLAVARKIIEAHDGRLFLDQGPGLNLVLQLPRSAS